MLNFISNSLVAIVGLSMIAIFVALRMKKRWLFQIIALVLFPIVAVQVVQTVRLAPSFWEQKERIKDLYFYKDAHGDRGKYSPAICLLPRASVDISVRTFCNDAARRWESLDPTLRASWLIIYGGSNFQVITDNDFLLIPIYMLALPAVLLASALLGLFWFNRILTIQFTRPGRGV